MSSVHSIRPAPDEYASYYGRYVAEVPDGDVLEILAQGLAETLAALRPVGEERASHRYEPGKWTLREVAGHVADTERIFAYRALRFARADTEPLAGMEQDEYIRHAGFERRPLAGILEEFEHQRRSNLALFRSFGAEELARRGTASGYEVSVRALLFILAGHERHHLGVLRSRYL